MVGSVRQALDFTALGDTVNTAARLGSIAGPEEFLVSDTSVTEAGHDVADLERRSVEVKGKSDPVEARTVERS